MGGADLSTIVTNCPNEQQILAIKEKLGECDDRLKMKETLFCDWYKLQQHFPKNYDHNVIRNLIRNSKYDVEEAKSRFVNYLLAKRLYPEFLCDRDASKSEIASFVERTNVLFLPNLTDRGQRLFIMGLEGSVDAEHLDIATGLKYSLMCYDLVLREEFPTNGVLCIVNGANVTFSHFAKLLTIAKPGVQIYRRAYGVRVHGIYVINAPTAIETMVNTIRPFLHDKLKQRITISKNMDILDVFPKNLLPKDYGGILESTRELSKKWHKYLQENEEWFKDQESNVLIGEIPRHLQNSLEIDDTYGADGSFRKLNVD